MLTENCRINKVFKTLRKLIMNNKTSM